MSVRKTTIQKSANDSRATVKLLSAQVTSHAERVCGEDRWALCVLDTLCASGQSVKKHGRKCRNTIFCPFFILWAIARSVLGNRRGYLIRNSARLPAISAVRRHRENWRGETACCEYRWEQLLTPPAHRSAVRLDRTVRTSLRRIHLLVGLSSRAVGPGDAYLQAPYLIFFCSIPEVNTGCLPSLLLEAHRQQPEPRKKESEQSVTCSKLFYLDWTCIMASLYQRFTGKINTTNSFPHPPEASHLLGGQVADEENAVKSPQQLVDGKPHVQYRKKCLPEDEDVRHFYLIRQHNPSLRKVSRCV